MWDGAFEVRAATPVPVLRKLGFRTMREIDTERFAGRRRSVPLEAVLIGLVGSLVGWALGHALTTALGLVEIRNPMLDVTRLPLVYSVLH